MESHFARVLVQTAEGLGIPLPQSKSNTADKHSLHSERPLADEKETAAS